MAINEKLSKIEGKAGIYLMGGNGEPIAASKIRIRPFKFVIKRRVNKKLYTEVITYSDKAPVAALEDAMKRRGLLGTQPKSEIKTVDALFDAYMEKIEPNRAKHYITGQKSTYNKHLKPTIGTLHPNKVTINVLQRIVNKMLKSGYAPRTAEQIQQLCRPMWKYGIKEHHLITNPAEDITLQKYDNRREFKLDEVSLGKLLKVIREYPNRKVSGILMFTMHGRRLNEVLTIKHDSIDLERREYTIESEHNKTRRRMTYPLTEALIEVVKEQPKSISPLLFPPSRERVTGKQADKMSASGINRHWKRITEQAGIMGMRIHDCRHALGFQMVNDGFSLEEIGRALGHLDPQTTQRYARTSVETARRVTDAFMKKIGG